jgi:hypothetical protein
MAEENNDVQLNITAERTVLNNFIANEPIETNQQKAEASFIKLEEIKTEPTIQENKTQAVQPELYVSPKIEQPVDTISLEHKKLKSDFLNFKEELNVVFPQTISSMYKQMYDFFNDSLNDNSKVDLRPIRPPQNTIFEVRSEQIKTSPLWS